MTLERLLGLSDGYLKRLADFYYPLEVNDATNHEINTRSTGTPTNTRRELDVSTNVAREFSFEEQS
jgi:hypothetical protein